jgi:hypothetical protein
MNMASKSKKTATEDEEIISKIYLIRDKKIMLDKDLADLYDVTTGNLNKTVKRNIKCIPKNTMFLLSCSKDQTLDIPKWNFKSGQLN